MYGDEIFEYLNENIVTHRYFIDVFAIDQLKRRGKINKRKWFLVCNCCASNLPGLHWFAIYKEDDTIEFFDSYGADPSVYGLDQFIKRQNVSLCLHNSTPYQSLTSNVCGHYTLFFGFWRCLGIPMYLIDSFFIADDYVFNDTLVYNSSNKIFMS